MFNYRIIDKLTNKVAENVITYNGYVFKDGEPCKEEDFEVLLGTGIMLDGKELFRGDILRDEDEENYLWEVAYRCGAWILDNCHFPGAIAINSIDVMKFEYAWNKFENPGLLEAELNE